MSLPHPSSGRFAAARRAARRRRRGLHVAARLFLVPAESGWSLLTRDGQTVVAGAGPAGRRRCLEFARAHGVLTVLS